MKVFVNLHKRFPFLSSVISLTLGAVMSYLFQNIIEVWKRSGTSREKLIACFLFIGSIILASIYYKYLYKANKKMNALEEEREKSEIKRIQNDRKMVDALYQQGTKEMENENLTIKEKTEIYRQISLITNDNKREN